ncbi:MAG: hypothetical protein LBS01_04850 [Prevotellaceae bacterium]|jgi:guanyl-specific ribonuclease Sa|nr:hypothetical protein [Prevotellaceae bacterium]
MKKTIIISLTILVAGSVLCLAFCGFFENITQNGSQQKAANTELSETQPFDLQTVNSADSSENILPIDELTAEKRVIAFLKAHGHLPDYYITKNEARRLGWDARQGNLCTVLPGRAIGGDRFSNREKSLPVQSGRLYFEADVNYNCGNRGADRVVFSNDGLFFLTHNHYKTFVKQ